MNKILKRIALGGSAVLIAAGAAFAGVQWQVSRLLDHEFEAHQMQLPSPPRQDQAAIARGEHLVKSRYACSACHGGNLAGGVMIDEPPIGRLFGPNLTAGRGNRVAGYTMADWDRSVRHGLKKDGRPSLMPSEDFFKMSDAELTDIVAYIDSLPSIDAETPPVQLGPIGKVLLIAGKIPLAAKRQDPNQAHAKEPPQSSDSVKFGEHLLATCTGCHRTNFSGGPIPFGPPDWPAAANLTPHEQGFAAWTELDFDRALTEGVSKGGRVLKPPMIEVVQGTKNMLPAERSAIWSYLKSLPPTATGK